jgi:hypothetical protein
MRVFLCEKPSQGKDIGRVCWAQRSARQRLLQRRRRHRDLVHRASRGSCVPPEAYGEHFKRWSH